MLPLVSGRNAMAFIQASYLFQFGFYKCSAVYGELLNHVVEHDSLVLKTQERFFLSSFKCNWNVNFRNKEILFYTMISITYITSGSKASDALVYSGQTALNRLQSASKIRSKWRKGKHGRGALKD